MVHPLGTPCGHTPLDTHTLATHILWAHTPLGTHSPWSHPPGTHTYPGHTSKGGHWNGRYVSYWNAFFFLTKSVFFSQNNIFNCIFPISDVADTNMSSNFSREAGNLRGWRCSNYLILMDVSYWYTYLCDTTSPLPHFGGFAVLLSCRPLKIWHHSLSVQSRRHTFRQTYRILYF